MRLTDIIRRDNDRADIITVGPQISPISEWVIFGTSKSINARETYHLFHKSLQALSVRPSYPSDSS